MIFQYNTISLAILDWVFLTITYLCQKTTQFLLVLHQSLKRILLNQIAHDVTRDAEPYAASSED